MSDPHELLLRHLMEAHAARFAVGGPVVPQGVNYAPQAAPQPQQPPSPVQGFVNQVKGLLPYTGVPSSAIPGGQAAPAPGGGQAVNNADGSAQTFKTPWGTSMPYQANLQFHPEQYQGTVGDSQQSLGQLSSLLMQQAQGNGPSAAQQMLKQQTDANIANAYAMSQANPNNGANARNAMETAGNLNQQAAGQAALARVNEQLGAQQQLGQLGLGQLGTAGRLMTDAQKLGLEETQGNQNLAERQTELAAGAAGNLLSTGLAGLSTLPAPGAPGAQTTGDPSTTPWPDGQVPDPATPQTVDTTQGPDTTVITDWHGGEIPRRFAQGGPVSYDYSGQSDVADPRTPNLLPSLLQGGASVASPGGAPPAGPKDHGGQASLQTGANVASPVLNMIPGVGPLLSTGLKAAVPAIANMADKYTSFWDALAHGFKAEGGPVGGRATRAGDSPDNDTVPAMLSPGEVVLPRSVTQDPEAEEKAKAFMHAIRVKHAQAKGARR